MPHDHEPDIFDEIASQGGPVGVHRAPRSLASRLWPPLLAFLLAGLLAFGVAVYFWNRDITPGDLLSPDPTPTATVPSSPSPTPTPSPSPETPSPTPTPTETAEPEPEVLFDAQVHVRNGANIAGLAGSSQEVLEDAGFTNVEANNISSSLIPGGTNVVTFGEERLADTAAAVAEALGIEAVDGSGTPGGAEIEVLLASDPAA